MSGGRKRITRRALILAHGNSWGIYIVDYDSSVPQVPCVDCGQPTITRALDNNDEPLCSGCAAWRLGRVEGLREAREDIAAKEKREAELAAIVACHREPHP